MAYQSLYRRYRPQRFSEVRGQPHVIAALHNAVRDGRTTHAYLFSGPRGTGKTSTARILAKALNCTDVRDGEPCGECESCLAIEAGTSYDLHELDAASNNGVDAVRDLIEKTSYGTSGRTKVYILDEVHMLSRAASNALLKTLEEPPAHVVFVLATTEPQKVLPTIRSRTQHFEFHLLPMDELDRYVRWIVGEADLSIDEEAITHVLRVGGGSARDTLSALDQVVAAGGVPTGTGDLDGLVEALCDADAGRALVAVDEALAAGRDARLVGEELLARLRDVFLCRMGVPLDRVPEGDRARISGWAERLGDRSVTRAMELLGDALTEISHQALDPRVSLEVVLLRMTRPEADANIEALAIRIDRLEKALASGATPTLPAPVVAPASDAAAPRPSGPSERPGASSSPRPVSDSRTSGSGSGSGLGAAASARAALGDLQQRPPAPAAPSARGGAPVASPPPPVPKQRQVPETRAAQSSVPAPDAELAEAQTLETAPGQAPTSAPAADAGTVPDRDILTVAWADSVLPGLSGLTRAMYAVGRFVDATDGGAAAVFALPNEVHRQRCEAKRGDVEAALARHFGHAVALRLVVDGGASVPGDSAVVADRGGSDSAGEPERQPQPGDDARPDEPIDVEALEDAPPDQRTPIDRIAEAFPGARIESDQNR